MMSRSTIEIETGGLVMLDAGKYHLTSPHADIKCLTGTDLEGLPIDSDQARFPDIDHPQLTTL
ncbi:hypothetical protein D3C72_1942100 [compost metagenome]